MTIFDHLLDILRMPNSVAGESRGEISVRRECLGEVGGVRHMTENAEAPQAQVDSQDDLDL